MAQYRLLEDFVTNHKMNPASTYCKAGATVTVPNDTVPAHFMVPLDDAAKKAFKAAGIENYTLTRDDFVDAISGQVDVTKYGASPQGNATGIALDLERAMSQQEG